MEDATIKYSLMEFILGYANTIYKLKKIVKFYLNY